MSVFPLAQVCMVLALGAGPAQAAPETPVPPAAPARAESAELILVSDDWPDWSEEVGRLTLVGVPPEKLAMAEPQYQRLALADKEKVEWLPAGYRVYQTISTAEILTVNVNLVVYRDRDAMCFNPEIPYCLSFDALSPILQAAGRRYDDQESAEPLARFLVELGQSTVHRPDNFIYMRLSQKMTPLHYNFIRDIGSIYEQHNEPYRTEARREEISRVTAAYGDVVRPLTITKADGGFRLHGFTYKIMRAAGDLREWDVLVRPNGTVKVEVKELEQGVGELAWPFAP